MKIGRERQFPGHMKTCKKYARGIVEDRLKTVKKANEINDSGNKAVGSPSKRASQELLEQMKNCPVDHDSGVS